MPGTGPRRLAGLYTHPSRARSTPSKLVSLCFFMYLEAQLPHGRLPSHLVLRARHRSHDAQRPWAPAAFLARAPLGSDMVGVVGWVGGCSSGWMGWILCMCYAPL